MRIQKYMSEIGYYSRNETDRLIKNHRILVNGSICEHNTLVNPGDSVLIDNHPLPEKERPVYLALNKPIGITCTAAKEVSNNIIDFVNYPTRIFPVGRLDKASEGLILMTNNGDIVNKILRSENGHEKEYLVTVDRPVTEEFIQRMANGVDILGITTKRCEVSQINEYEFRIILKQGLNRQIRRMSKALGYRVVRLERVRIMNIMLQGIAKGDWRELSKGELEELLTQLK
ncbi:pseudouridine synthase [Peribacillus deserti]|uniref:Pseudouridine synthase n=1 Tax=Peribacillus deserti TaxID=673318 RepID=A0A2N5M341_9BACI|nr:pseudouridine synthase [Peribacillus deserti]PLT28789.1 23S rRNA pseudouridine synthase F [Peribacillus deserti]